jgi:hypothetical protein
VDGKIDGDKISGTVTVLAWELPHRFAVKISWLLRYGVDAFRENGSFYLLLAVAFHPWDHVSRSVFSPCERLEIVLGEYRDDQDRSVLGRYLRRCSPFQTVLV